MTLNAEVAPFVDDDAALSFTQRYRVKLIKALAPDDKALEDPKTAATVASVLNDINSQALGKKRIKTVEKGIDKAAQVAAFVAQISSKMGNADHAAVQGRVGGPPRHGEKLIDDVVVVPDELHEGTQCISLADIMGDTDPLGGIK